jgi:hypothetical protein
LNSATTIDDQCCQYGRVKCNPLAAYVSRVADEQKEPLYWLARSFTAVGGDFWCGVVSGSDRCPRDRTAELAVRLAALGREVIASLHPRIGTWAELARPATRRTSGSAGRCSRPVG